SATLADTTQYYNPPKLIKQGTNTTPVAGSGTVVIQVLVNADGSFKVQKVVSSTNHDDDAAAMEIAQSAKYAPATKDRKKVTAFYTYRLKFVTGGGASTSGSSSSNSLAGYTADVRAGRYTTARAGLTTYLQSHPDDAQADTLLGVSEYFLNNYSDAASAFNKAGTVSPQYVTVAANAYAKATQSAIAAKNGSAAVAYATKAKQLEPGAAMWNLLGNAQVVADDNGSAVQSFEQARTLAASDPKMDAKERGTITANLITAYVNADQVDKASALLPELKQQDPNNTVALSHVVDYYARKAQAAQKAGNFPAAVGLYDRGASLGGPFAVTMYTNEAMAYMSAQRPDFGAAKIAADKALAVNPDDARANLAEGMALVQTNKPKEALPYLQKAQTAAKASGDAEVAARAQQILSQVFGASTSAGPGMGTHPER
ncbi:MAG: TonB family protein, partial [Candidatus Eremiobacteraeota bacterium]|nr:TonB family protein [Candidatus Eremiobacteraeota bacterium]